MRDLIARADLLSEAATELRKVREVPVVCVAPSAMRHEGWTMYWPDGNSIMSLPFAPHSKVRLVAVGEGEAS